MCDQDGSWTDRSEASREARTNLADTGPGNVGPGLLGCRRLRLKLGPWSAGEIGSRGIRFGDEDSLELGTFQNCLKLTALGFFHVGELHTMKESKTRIGVGAIGLATPRDPSFRDESVVRIEADPQEDVRTHSKGNSGGEAGTSLRDIDNGSGGLFVSIVYDRYVDRLVGYESRKLSVTTEDDLELRTL